MTMEESKIQASGVLIFCKSTDRVFLLLRNDKTPSWSLVSGSLEEGEEPIVGLQREIAEELSINPSLIEYEYLYSELTPNQRIMFNYYKGYVDEEFIPILDHENLEYGWFGKSEIPDNLFYKLEEKLLALWPIK
jgi:8-oxo-dGTP pyrophosphatase MutT (NUDIX family)